MPIRSRRQFISGFGCGCLAAAAPWTASPILAASPKPKTTVTADQAIELLKQGNADFLNGSCTATSPERIHSLAGGQAPFAVIVGCSDSRTPPETLFNRGLGELFIVRVAGNTVEGSGLGSVEYGTGVLGARLVLVLGHTQCGAVDAAIEAVTKNVKFPGAIGSVVAPIIPAVRSLKGGDDLARRAVRANVQRVVARLKAKPTLAKSVADGKIKVAGAVYDLATGKVDFGVAA